MCSSGNKQTIDKDYKAKNNLQTTKIVGGDNYIKSRSNEMKCAKRKENNLTALRPFTLETLTMLPKICKIPNEMK